MVDFASVAAEADHQITSRMTPSTARPAEITVPDPGPGGRVVLADRAPPASRADGRWGGRSWIGAALHYGPPIRSM